MESIPVSGVAIRNETVELREAPPRRRLIAAGKTPQEHKGKGAPKSSQRQQSLAAARGRHRKRFLPGCLIYPSQGVTAQSPESESGVAVDYVHEFYRQLRGWLVADWN